MSARVLLLPANQLDCPALLAATSTNPVVTADCYVDTVESWEPRPWGWETSRNGRRILNIDHHADDPRFFRAVSSGNLAIDYVAANGALAPDVPVIINHTDCDSVIAAAILAGLLPPDPVHGEAVIAADHTGAANAIANLLQALEPVRDFDFCFDALQRLLRNQPMDPRALEYLKQRDADRARAVALVRGGAFQIAGSVAVAVLAGEKVPGEFLPSLLPHAAVIVSASPMASGLLETKVRIGLAALPGETLYSLDVRGIEPNFRGRWNAGSTRRSGGSTIDPIELARRINQALERQRAGARSRPS